MTAVLRSAGARLAVLLGLVATLGLLFVGSAQAQSDDNCYPLPVDGCEEPEVQPSVIDNPPNNPAPEPTNGENPAPEPTNGENPAPSPSATTPQTDPTLAQTGLESSTIAFIAVGLVVVGAGAIALGRKRETADA